MDNVKTFKEVQQADAARDDRERSEKCLMEINQVLARYDCDMMPEMIMSPGQIAGRIKIQPKRRDVGPAIVQ